MTNLTSSVVITLSSETTGNILASLLFFGLVLLAIGAVWLVKKEVL